VGARVHDAVHVEVEVVKLFAVWIRARTVDGDDGSVVHLDGLLLNDRADDLGVLLGEPSEGGGNAHGEGRTGC
jgi:hypothetical protein